MTVAIGAGNFDRLDGCARNCHLNLLDRANLNDRFGGLFQHQLFVNAPNLGSFLVGLATASAVFFSGGQRNVMYKVTNARCILCIDAQSVLVALEVNLFALGENLVLAVLFVPLRDGRVLVHILDNFAPADAGVVSAEGNFALLRGVRNDAHFRAAEVVVEKILEPHTGDKKEIPRILAALHGVFNTAVWGSAPVLGGGLLRQGPGLVEFLEKIVE